MNYRRSYNTTQTTGCFTFIVVLLINLLVGTWSVIEILSWFGKTIPTIASVVIGLFAGEISIPVAIVGSILKAFHVF